LGGAVALLGWVFLVGAVALRLERRRPAGFFVFDLRSPASRVILSGARSAKLRHPERSAQREVEGPFVLALGLALALGVALGFALTSASAFQFSGTVASQLSFRYSKFFIASRRAAFTSLSLRRSSASMLSFDSASFCSASVQSGHRFANPGLSGFNSNSSEQITQTLIGNAMLTPDNCYASNDHQTQDESDSSGLSTGSLLKLMQPALPNFQKI